MIISISGKANSGKDLVAKIIKYLTCPLYKYEKISYNEYLNTIANPDSTDHISPFKVKKFADKLKDMVCLLLDCSREDLEDEEFKNKELGEEWWYYNTYKHSFQLKPKVVSYNNYRGANYYNSELIKLTPRKLLQLLGTEAGREIIHPNIWVNALMNKYKKVKVERPLCEKGLNMPKGELCCLPGLCREEMKTQNFKYPNWIITDVRFPNEYQAIQKHDHLHIHLERFQVGDKVNWNDPELDTLAEWEIFECYDDSCLIGLSGLGHREIESEAEVPYSELSIVESDEHKSENTDLLKEYFNKDVVYLYNVGDIEDLIEKLDNILNKLKIKS